MKYIFWVQLLLFEENFVLSFLAQSSETSANLKFDVKEHGL